MVVQPIIYMSIVTIHPLHIRTLRSNEDAKEAVRLLEKHSFASSDELEIDSDQERYEVIFRKGLPIPSKGPSLEERQMRAFYFIKGYMTALDGKIIK